MIILNQTIGKQSEQLKYQGSQDVVFGTGNDVPTFSLLTEVIAMLLGVVVGTLTVNVGSLHLYSKHIPMAKELVNKLEIDVSFFDKELEDFKEDETQNRSGKEKKQ